MGNGTKVEGSPEVHWPSDPVMKQTNSRRNQNKARMADHSQTRVEKNIIVNRLCTINGLIEFDWLNLSFESYKFICKSLIST